MYALMRSSKGFCLLASSFSDVSAFSANDGSVNGAQAKELLNIDALDTSIVEKSFLQTSRTVWATTEEPCVETGRLTKLDGVQGTIWPEMTIR